MTIEVFAEIACPFTHLSLRRIVDRRRDLGRIDPVLWVRPWPLELVNGEPLAADHVAKEVRALREQIAPDLFAGFDPSSFPATSMPAFRLAEAASAADARTGEAVSLALREALFEQGRDVSDPAVLAEVAAAHGLEVPGDGLDDVVRQAQAEGKARGVAGSPHFFVAGTSVFCPMLDIQRDDEGEFHLTLDEPAVTEQLDRWLTEEG